ncbi:MAG TPA: cytochrome c3 family protein [Candidatus Polarisedimenticolia bacterium]|nr:cytochrome c3 family protein [Candidatus Polarisedimenticolia bacterium]
MAQIFHRSFNVLSRVSIFGAVFFLAALAWVFGTLDRSPYVTNADVVREQPIPFSHRHHVAGLGIDCRYCHTSVETSAFAGIPPTKTCMNCHSQIWSDSPMLEPVRASFREDRPIRWTRVNDLPDFTYFNHSIHVTRGIGCVTCHGRVDQMPLTYQEHPLLMEWCLDCHRDPGQHVRPRGEVFNMSWEPPAEPLQVGRSPLPDHDARQATDCWTCHR